MKKLFLPLAILTLTLGIVASGVSYSQVNANQNREDIVGAWEVQAVGAPYEPHLFTFNADGTMLTTNPTNVQEDASDPHGGTNDSVGMGAWKFKKTSDKDTYIGTFYQLNANADDHTPADTLSVSFKIKVTDDTFDGTAIAKLGSFTAPATLHGERLGVDTDAVDGL